MTEIESITTIPREVAINNNEQYVYWGDFLKRLVAAIRKGEEIKDAVKAKIKEYRATTEEGRQKEEKKLLAKARKDDDLAIAAKTIPDVEGLHFRKTLKWRVKKLKQVPRDYLTLDKKKIDDTVKALGREHGIRGIETFEEEVAVVKQ